MTGSIAKVNRIGLPVQWQDQCPLLEELHTIQARVMVLFSKPRNHLQDLVKIQLMSSSPQLLFRASEVGPKFVFSKFPTCCYWSENHPQSHCAGILETLSLEFTPEKTAGPLTVQAMSQRFVLYSRDRHYIHLEKAMNS